MKKMLLQITAMGLLVGPAAFAEDIVDQMITCEVQELIYSTQEGIVKSGVTLVTSGVQPEDGLDNSKCSNHKALGMGLGFCAATSDVHKNSYAVAIFSNEEVDKVNVGHFGRMTLPIAASILISENENLALKNDFNMTALRLSIREKISESGIEIPTASIVSSKEMVIALKAAEEKSLISSGEILSVQINSCSLNRNK